MVLHLPSSPLREARPVHHTRLAGHSHLSAAHSWNDGTCKGGRKTIGERLRSPFYSKTHYEHSLVNRNTYACTRLRLTTRPVQFTTWHVMSVLYRSLESFDITWPRVSLMLVRDSKSQCTCDLPLRVTCYTCLNLYTRPLP